MNKVNNKTNMSEEIIKKESGTQLLEMQDAFADGYIPDQIFPTDNDWEIPVLDISMQATEVAIPFLKYGEQSRIAPMYGNGTIHFYTDDYKFSALYEDPSKLVKARPRSIVEPNFSLYLDMAPAFGLQAIYKKRVIARMMQEHGIRVFVDLNVAQKFIKLNLIGVPRGWRSFATRGYSDRIDTLEVEYAIAEASAGFAGRKPLFVCYGGGSKCKDFCKSVGAIYITPNLSVKKREGKFDKLLNDNVIAFTDADFSREALEEGRTNARLDQISDFRQKAIAGKDMEGEGDD